MTEQEKRVQELERSVKNLRRRQVEMELEKTLLRKDIEGHEVTISRLKDVCAAREKELDDTKRTLKRCVNELCLRCGEYQREHLGACRGCVWLAVRHGETGAAG